MTRQPLAGLALLALLGCGVVETGYLDDTDPLGGTDAGIADDNHESDLAHEVAVDLLLYTSLDVLDDEPTPVTVVGLPGALVGEGLQAVVDGAPPVVATVNLVAASFVVDVAARLNDTVRLQDLEGLELGVLLLTDDLSTLSVPDPLLPGDTDTDSQDRRPWPTVVGGQVDVGDGSLPNDPPYLAYVAATGASARVATGDTEVPLAAAVGDALCVATVDDQDRTGPAVCATLE